MIEAGQFNGSTLDIGEDWQILTIHEILLVQGLKHGDGWLERDGETITDAIENLLITFSEVVKDIHAVLEDNIAILNQVFGKECEFVSGPQCTERRDEDTRAFELIWD